MWVKLIVTMLKLFPGMNYSIAFFLKRSKLCLSPSLSLSLIFLLILLYISIFFFLYSISFSFLILQILLIYFGGKRRYFLILKEMVLTSDAVPGNLSLGISHQVTSWFSSGYSCFHDVEGKGNSFLFSCSRQWLGMIKDCCGNFYGS